MARRKLLMASAMLALYAGGAVLPANAAQHTIVVTTTIQAAVNAASPGDTVLVPAGVYHETVTIATSGLTIKGTRDAVLDATGFSVGIRASAGSITIGSDGYPVCPAFGLHDLAVDGLTITGASFTGVLFRGVDGFAIRDGIYTGNGAYAVFPICSRDGVIERIHADGTADGAIYVGDSWDVVVADNRVSASTAGIEIENSIGIKVVGNQAIGNTAGIVVFSLPGLPVTATANVLVADNTVTNNNLPNPIPFGSGIVGNIPTGTGILAVATQDTLITNNRVNRNDSGGIAVVAFSLPSGDPRFDPLPTHTVVSDNTVRSNGTAPDQVRSPIPGADLIYDGSGSGNCFEHNRFGTSFPAGIEGLFACP
jgi:parallel beta-helix repeat protein